MIVVCLLTCGREELTRRTVESFAQFNAGRPNTRLLHIDVASHGNENCEIAAGAGFETILKAEARLGQMETLRKFAEVVQPDDWALWLENDWESVAPIPSDDTIGRFAFSFNVETVRLFGSRKMRGDGPRAFAGPHRMGTKEKIGWFDERIEPGWQFGRAHWGGGGCLLIGRAFQECAEEKRIKDYMAKNNWLSSARPKENIMFHIGEKTTPGFRD